LQLSPIFSFASFPYRDPRIFFAAGNFYGVLPFEGRYDAMDPTLFEYNKKSGQFKFISEFPAIGGECRDAKWINCRDGNKVLVLARNNDHLVFLKPIP